MSIKLQDIVTSTNLDMTDKVLVSDGTSEHLVTVETFLGRMSTMFQGMQSSTAKTISGTTISKIPLVNDGVEVPFGDSGMSISDGGIKVTAAGTYRVTASAYLIPSNLANRSGLYIFYGTSFTDGEPPTGATEACGVFDVRSTTVQVTGVVMNVSANTIFYLAGRAWTGATTTASNGWLLVERLA